MWAAQTHKNTAHHFQFTSGANCPPSLSPFPSHFLTPPRLVLCLFIFPISSPKFHGLRNQTQLHWLTEAHWHNIPSKVTLPCCASISPFPPLHVSRSVFIRLSSLCHSLPIPWPWSVFLMEKKAAEERRERVKKESCVRWMEKKGTVNTGHKTYGRPVDWRTEAGWKSRETMRKGEDEAGWDAGRWHKICVESSRKGNIDYWDMYTCLA